MTDLPRPDNRLPIMQMAEAADWLVAIATKWEPTGMVEVLELWKRLPEEVLLRMAEAWRIMSQKAQAAYPVKPVVLDLIDGVYQAQVQTARHAQQIAPTIASVHREQLEALDDRRNAMWDHRANRSGTPA